MTAREIILAHYSAVGKLGGEARARLLSPARRREIAMLGVAERLRRHPPKGVAPAPAVVADAECGAQVADSDDGCLPRAAWG